LSYIELNFNIMKNGVYRLNQEATLKNGLVFKKGQEFEIVNGVLYMGGFPIDTRVQQTILSWMEVNQNLFKNDTRGW
jgi:hypothetical protein